MPPGPERDLALDAFRRKYENKPRPIDTLRYLSNSPLWVSERLGEFTWSKQNEILFSVLANRRTAVKSCHGPGKSFIAARIACHWIDVHPSGSARVITSAPTGDQIKAILWQEISRAHSKGKLAGRLNQTEWWLSIGNREELVGIGRKPKDYSTSAFQGIHERYVLVIFDEACGIPKSLWEAAEGLLSNEECRFLSIGNPEDPDSEFFNECKPGSGTNVITISAFDTPNFTGEYVPDEVKARLVSRLWVEEKATKWGINSPMYKAKVLGEFPEHSSDGLIPISWIRAAQERTLVPSTPVELGVDVGGGGNANTIARRNGPVVRVVHNDTNPDTMATLSATLEEIKISQASQAKVDYIGIGHGSVDRAKEMASDQQVKKQTPQLASNAAKIIGVEVGRTAQDSEQYVNLRAEGYWLLRERFREGNIDIDPSDDDLAAQLTAIRYKRSGGRIQIESKEEMRRRGVSSPDKADAVMLAFLDPPKEEKKSVLTVWGS
jgi:hypothetical protein